MQQNKYHENIMNLSGLTEMLCRDDLEATAYKAGHRDARHAAAEIANAADARIAELTAEIDALRVRAEAIEKRAIAAEVQLGTLRPKLEDCEKALREAEARAENQTKRADAYAKSWGEVVQIASSQKTERDQLRAALEAVEWVGAFIACPWCRGEEHNGHYPDCQRQLALGGAEGEGK